MKELDYVNTKIGSFNEPRFSNGNIYPITSRPFGTANFTVQTNGGNNWFYDPTSHSFEGIRLTHQPSPWVGDYGHMLFLPFSGALEKDRNCRWSSYRPQNALIKPHITQVFLQRYRVTASVVPTVRGGIIRVENHKNDKETGFAVIPFGASAFTVKENIVTGYTDAQSVWNFARVREYFYMEFSETFRAESIENGGFAAFFKGRTIEVKIAASFVSVEQAKINFDRELAGETFDGALTKAEAEWQNYLGRIKVSGDEERKKTFYSCFYRALLYPRVFHEYDENGLPVHFNADTQKIEKGVFYTDNGFWDTFRTEYPFLSVIAPELVREMVEGFINYSDETGWLPKWLSPGEIGLMPGTLIEAVIADACVKGIVTGDLMRRAYKAMLKNAYEKSEDPRHGRQGITDYIKYGYVPMNYKESVNHTCDCAYGDYCISVVASLNGDKEQAEKLLSRSKSYANLFDNKTHFLRARDERGNFREPFDPYIWGGDNCEGSSWQNSFAVYHDINGLADLYGGKEKLSARLDELFYADPVYEVDGYAQEIHEMSEMACADFGQCAISNQPSFHIPWIYSYIGERDKTEKWVKKLASEAFSSSLDGFPGDEDNGTTACWYIFACLGFYPLCPGSGEYVCSSPLFDSIEINGKKIRRYNGNTVKHGEITGE